MSAYVPKILLCGDREDFFAEIGNIPVKIVGNVEFSGKAGNEDFNFTKDGRLFLNGHLTNYTEIVKILREGGGGLYSFQQI